MLVSAGTLDVIVHMWRAFILKGVQPACKWITTPPRLQCFKASLQLLSWLTSPADVRRPRLHQQAACLRFVAIAGSVSERASQAGR